jgi:membrane protein DedA with SNARE-associated domain
MDIFLHWIKHVIKTYGYLGVFGSQMLGMFGLPVPDETILTFTGFLISKGIMQPLPAFLAAYLGSIGGITLNYLVGRYVGWPLLHKYGFYLHLNDKRIDQAHQWFGHYGKVALFAGYFFPGVRHLTAFSAGASRLEFRQFFPYAYSGGLCWVATFLALGYFLGEEWHLILPQVQSYLWLGVGLAVFLVLGYYLGRRLRNYARRP